MLSPLIWIAAVALCIPSWIPFDNTESAGEFGRAVRKASEKIDEGDMLLDRDSEILRWSEFSGM